MTGAVPYDSEIKVELYINNTVNSEGGWEIP